jgi:hypothetical protein
MGVYGGCIKPRVPSIGRCVELLEHRDFHWCAPIRFAGGRSIARSRCGCDQAIAVEEEAQSVVIWQTSPQVCRGFYFRKPDLINPDPDTSNRGRESVVEVEAVEEQR